MSKKPRSAPADACPCGGGKYASCCGRFLDGDSLPATAQELMRSRYTAYVRYNEAYLRATWYPSTRPAPGLLEGDAAIKWLSLEICAHEQKDNDATVEFIARYKEQGRAQGLHEISRFVREGGRWYYLDGSFPTPK